MEQAQTTQVATQSEGSELLKTEHFILRDFANGVYVVNSLSREIPNAFVKDKTDRIEYLRAEDMARVLSELKGKDLEIDRIIPWVQDTGGAVNMVYSAIILLGKAK